MREAVTPRDAIGLLRACTDLVHQGVSSVVGDLGPGLGAKCHDLLWFWLMSCYGRS